MYTHSKQWLQKGKPFSEADKVLVMLHGRGATAQSIVSLIPHLDLQSAHIIAPQATNNSWYPYGFMAPDADNQPALDTALEQVDQIIQYSVEQGIDKEHIYFLGFSQGACLVLEYVGRHAHRYGGVVAFTGGLIGAQLEPSRYSGDLDHTPVLITTGDPDAHVPLTRVHESVAVFDTLNADVALEVYAGRPHTISDVELVIAKPYLTSTR